MDNLERRGWRIVAVIFLTIFLINGSSYMTQSLFFTPILKTFGWSRAQVSSLTAMINIAIAFGALPAGWLLDRVAARWVMLSGVALVALSFVLASHAHSYSVLVTADLVMGLGISASTMVPGAFVVANWFEGHRGVAMSIIASGQALGGMVMNLVVSRMIAAFGWRYSYLLLTVPLLVIVMPLVAVLVRNRPVPKASPGASPVELPGYELGEAMRTWSFWLLILGIAGYCSAANGTLLHLVPDLLTFGYTPTHAALAVAMVLGWAGVVKIGLGMLADRSGGRPVLAGDMIVYGLGIAFIFFARRPLCVVLYVLTAGGTSGAPSALFPFVIAETMGLRRYGTISGIMTWAQWLAGIGGILAGGWIFDLTHHYEPAFAIYMIGLWIGAAAVLAVRPYSSRQREQSSPMRLAGAS